MRDSGTLTQQEKADAMKSGSPASDAASLQLIYYGFQSNHGVRPESIALSICRCGEADRVLLFQPRHEKVRQKQERSKLPLWPRVVVLGRVCPRFSRPVSPKIDGSPHGGKHPAPGNKWGLKVRSCRASRGMQATSETAKV